MQLEGESAPRPGPAWDDAEMAAYVRRGEERAHQLGNRGPIRFSDDGDLHPEIVEAYGRCGFYVFTGVVGDAELAELRADVDAMLQRAPVTKGATIDGQGRPALGVGLTVPIFVWARPLSDPVGGTDKNQGRHPARMAEPDVPAGAPAHVIQIILGTLQLMDTCLRVYGHPRLLAVAAAVNGANFAPFNEALFIKQPGLGASVAWHQDATTHWDSPQLDDGTHGFNFMLQLYGSTAANGVWVVPGSHKARADIAGMVAANGGSDRLPGAVPLVCGPGDVFMNNRQVVHGSFANTSADLRVTVNFGFHRRASVLGVATTSIHGEEMVYDESFVHERSRVIALAIDARHRHRPDEEPYIYEPLVGQEEANRWTEAARQEILWDYNVRDLRI